MNQSGSTDRPRPRGIRGVSRRNFVRGLSAAGAGGLVIGGAGGYPLGSSGSSASSGDGKDGKPVKIGLVAPVTGPYSGDGQEMSRGAQLAVEALNAHGGVGGREVRLVTADVSNLSPENFVQAAQRLTGLEKVAASFGGYCSNNSVEFRTYADSGMPMFHFNTLQANVDHVQKNKIDNIYHCCPTEIWYGRGFVPLMQSWVETKQWKPSAKTAAVVTSNDPYSISIANALATEIKKIGWAVSLFEQVTAPTADWGPVLSKIRANPPGLIFVTDYIAGDLASFAKQFATAPTPSLLYQQYGPSVPEYMQLAGDAANGVIWSTAIGTLPDDLGQSFFSEYEKKFHAKPGMAQAGCEYDMIRMWAEAAALAGDPYDFARVNAIVKETIFRGVNGIYRLAPPQLHGQLAVAPYPDLLDDPSLGIPHLTYQIQDRRQVVISPTPYTSGTLQLPPWIKG